MSFCTLFWDDITIIWDKILFSFLTEKKNLFWTNKKFVYLIFINKIMMISTKNIVQKDMNKFIVFVFDQKKNAKIEPLIHGILRKNFCKTGHSDL